jgi:hypothetical protein
MSGRELASAAVPLGCTAIETTRSLATTIKLKVEP